MAQRFGLTWWGQRWIAALEHLGATWENRLPRGRTYARKGTVHDLVIHAGRVTAHVDGSRPSPYRVTIGLATFDDQTWDAVVDALAGQLRHAAALLDGRMPEDVDDTLTNVGVSLFPTGTDLQTTCSCPDWANPCKHVAAVHYVLATRFDDDPFLLMELRGRSRDDLLAGLRARRAGTGADPVEVRADAGHVDLDDLVPAMLFEVEAEPQDLDIVVDHGDVRATLRRLGPLPGPLQAAKADVEAAVDRAAAAARALLTGADADADAD